MAFPTAVNSQITSALSKITTTLTGNSTPESTQEEILKHTLIMEGRQIAFEYYMINFICNGDQDRTNEIMEFITKCGMEFYEKERGK